ncbi:hypothetical protein [Paenibacillus amylolyticus]|uniref:Uncharacterized protein n=1 Tax=Paenibacillus amylolyticus TaxID=1451 RepID=A0ABD8B2Q0_PAEAM
MTHSLVVRQLDDDTLNSSLADLMGFHFYTEEIETQRIATLTPQEISKWFHPCKSITDAMMVQSKALEIGPDIYCNYLLEIFEPAHSMDITYKGLSNMLQATPRQRSEAAWVTLDTHFNMMD